MVFDKKNLIGGGKRVDFADALKGVTIFLVVYMHCLECVKGQYFGEPGIMEDKLFAFVLSFHMPVFMMLSGFFAKSLRTQTVQYLVVRRYLPILIPLILWTGLSSIWHPTWKINFVYGREYWFLNCVLVIYSLFLFIRFIPEKFEGLYCLIICIVTMLFEKFTYAHVNSMIPFFCIGYLLKKHYKIFENNAKLIFFISFTIFCILSFFWDIKWTIYLTPIHLLSNTSDEILHIVYRLIIGVAGLMAFFSLFKIAYGFVKDNIISSIFEWLGQHTLAIYFIHYFFYWVYLLPSCATDIVFIDDFLITPLYTFVLLAICSLIIIAIRHNKYVAYLVLGEKL